MHLRWALARRGVVRPLGGMVERDVAIGVGARAVGACARAFKGPRGDPARQLR